MGDKKYGSSLNVKYDKILERDEHVTFYVYGDSLKELNSNAREIILEYKELNGLSGTAEYYLGDTKGSIASTLDAIGRV